MSKIHSVNCIGQMAGIDPAIRPGWLYGNQVFNGAANITPADMNYLLSICRNRLCKLSQCQVRTFSRLLHSSDDFDRNANRKTELTVRAPLIEAISASPLEFSYQKAMPGGRSLKVPAHSSTRPATTSLDPRCSVTALRPVIALPK